METYKELSSILTSIKLNRPLIHHITNYVTVNDCANITLALGGSPIMADDPREVEEIVSRASALVLNTGTLNERRIESYIVGGKRANELGIPVVLDPVGVGVSKLRNRTIEKILKEVQVSVLRGNLSEIKNICGYKSPIKGVDSMEDSLDRSKEIALNLSKDLKCVVAITGKVDVVSKGKGSFYIENGVEILTRITGSGCMTTSLIGLCVSVSMDPLYGTILALMIMGISGEKAMGRLRKSEGTGSFRTYLMDEVSNFSMEDIEKRGKIYEIK